MSETVFIIFYIIYVDIMLTSHDLNQWYLVFWRIHASLGLNELRYVLGDDVININQPSEHVIINIKLETANFHVILEGLVFITQSVTICPMSSSAILSDSTWTN